jgi:PD-(D/E)XK endonuclease
MGSGRKVGRVAGAGGTTGRNNSKHVGEVAEMQFMLDAAKRGFGVARPFANNQRYDVILDAPRRLWRVQVKASGASHHRGFAVRASWRTTHKHMPYTSKQIDFLAVVIQGRRMRGRRIWYLIPVRSLGGRLTINLYPFGCRKDGEERFEKYREAWKLLGEPGLPG